MKYKYGQLEQRENWGNWYFYFNDNRLGESYSSYTLIEALNELGEDGWQLVSSYNNENWILMKAV